VPAFSSVFIGAGLVRDPLVVGAAEAGGTAVGAGAAGGGVDGVAGCAVVPSDAGVAGVAAGCGSPDAGAAAGGFFLGVRFG